MCDNCFTGLRITVNDMTQEAINIVNFLCMAVNVGNNFTMNQAIDLVRGKKLTTKFPVDKNLITQFSGRLKQTKEDHLRRLMIKLLIMGAIEEEFHRIRAGPTNNIVVYLTVGKNAAKVQQGRIQV